MKKLILIITLTIYSTIAFSQQNLVGKKAPKIDIENWIYPKIQVSDWHTKKVPKDLSGKIIVLDFWFTKCAPCVASIPKLNQLAKQFPEIVFLSITFNETKEINDFLDKMVMYYPVGSDPEQKTIRAYGVSGFPETFLIDENGIIKWQGSPFNLNKDILNKTLGRQIRNTINVNNSELQFENSAYSFSIQKNNLGMGESSYYHYNPFDINVFNKDLENMLKVFYGINKSRILTHDSTLLETKYDLTLKVNKEITNQANCIEMVKYLLQKKMDFKLKEFSKDTLVGIIQIENDSLLSMHKSNSQYFGTTMRYDNWEGKGASIEDLKDFLEDNYSVLLDVNKRDNRKFDFIISSKDLNKTKETLKNEYGLIVNIKNQKISFWEISK